MGNNAANDASILRWPQAPRRAAACDDSKVGDAMVDDSLTTELERLKAENERLKRDRGRAISLKVSEKGGVSVYGLGRFPVTLYKEQWITLLAMTDEIRAFLAEHDAVLKTKSTPWHTVAEPSRGSIPACAGKPASSVGGTLMRRFVVEPS